MQHRIVVKEKGRYNAFPVLNQLPDGRLTIGCISSPFGDHYGLAGWLTFESRDHGRTWTPSEDPMLPPNWPGTSPRERYDRLSGVLPDGTLMAVGSVGQEIWPLDRREEAEARSLRFVDDETYTSRFPGKLIISGYRLSVIRSRDGGHTWDRRTWTVSGYESAVGFPRGTVLEDGTWLFPVYTTRAGGESDCLLFRSSDDGETWHLHEAVPRIGSEWALVETEPNRVLGHIRSTCYWDPAAVERTYHRDRFYTMEVWSEDGGSTWTSPIEASFEGYPNHLLKLRDGRILCTYGYRRAPMGIRALISEDGGRTWDTDHEYVLRDDGGGVSSAWPPEKRPRMGGADVGYPISAELDDGTMLTVYYITTEDETTHVAATLWHPDRDRPPGPRGG